MLVPLPPDWPLTMPVVLCTIQLKVVPDTWLLKAILVALLLQIVRDGGVAIALGVGLANTVAVMGTPVQPFTVGVMVKVTVTGAFVVLVKAPLILPVPLEAMPVTALVLSLLQLYVVPGTVLDNTIVVIADPEQIVCAAGVAVATGTWLKVTVTGTLGSLTQFSLIEYSNSILEMLVVAPNSLQRSRGLNDVSGNCIPRRWSCTGNPAMVVL